MSEFNQHFRNEIIKGFEKIIGKSAAKVMADAIEYAERISVEKLNVGEIKKLSDKLLTTLSDPINISIDESLEDLEDAICPIYKHLTTSYGENNLYFVTTISLLLSYHEDSQHLETLLDKKFLKQTSNLNEVMLGNAVLLLAHYVRWTKSLAKIEKFVAEFHLPVKYEPAQNHRHNESKKTKLEYIGYCSVCKNPFISKGSKTCSNYCANKAAAANLVISTPTKNNFEYESWLSSQPWDEENLNSHKSSSDNFGSTKTVQPHSVSPSTMKPEPLIQKKEWLKTQKGLQNKETGLLISFADTLRSVFPIPGYSINRHSIGFIKDSEIENS
jgi:hypothetical protein